MEGYIKNIANDMRVIIRFNDNQMSNEELRLHVEWLCKDERLFRSFMIYYSKDKN